MMSEMNSEDDAITALLLLKHQAESANLTECTMATSPPYEVLAIDNPLVTKWHLTRKGPGRITGSDVLLTHQLSETVYIDQSPADNLLLVPAAFAAKINDSILIDDCHHTLFGKVQNIMPYSKKMKALQIAGFLPQNFEFPISVNIMTDRMYYLGQDALYRSSSPAMQREQIIPDLSDVQFSANENHLEITVKPKYGDGMYHVSI